MVPQPIFDLIGLARGEAMPPQRKGALAVVGVEQLGPRIAVGRAVRRAGELVPAPIEEVVVAVGAGRPNHLVDRVHDRVQIGAILLERALDALALGDFEEQHREPLVAERMGARLVGAVLERRDLDLERRRLAGVDDSAEALHDAAWETGNDLADAAAQRRFRRAAGLLRERLVDLEEDEIDDAAAAVADDLGHVEALVELREELAVLRIAQLCAAVDVDALRPRLDIALGHRDTAPFG